MTNDTYIELCKKIKERDQTNKMVAALHEMGHYLVATNIKSSIITVRVDSIQLLQSINGKWYGFTRITYIPNEDSIDPNKYHLEVRKKKLRIANAGMCVEKAMFGAYDTKGCENDQEMIDEAKLFIRENDPDFDIDKYLQESETILKKHLNTIALRAFKLYYKTLNAVIQYPEEINQE
jgi:hypothetical protein